MATSDRGGIDTALQPDKTIGWVESVRATLERRFRKVLSPVVNLLRRLGIKPNQVTILELLLNLLAAAFIIHGWLLAAGIIFLVAGIFDVVDGSLARLTSQVTAFGAFLDSTLDRVSEGIIYSAIAYRFTVTGQETAVVFVVLALLGSLLTSYARARAEALGISCKVGVVSRTERVILISAGLLFNVLTPVIYLLVLLTGYTVAQRIYHVRRNLLPK